MVLQKVILTLALSVGAMNADVIRFYGTVTDALPTVPGSVSVGDTFVAWAAFEVVNNSTYETWTPGALSFFCNRYPTCTPTTHPGYTVFLGARGVAYSNGYTYTTGSWGNAFEVKLNSDLSVAYAQTTGGELIAGWLQRGDSVFIHSYGQITGELTFAEFSQVPEPSTFLLAAPVLLLCGYRSTRRGHSATA